MYEVCGPITLESTKQCFAFDVCGFPLHRTEIAVSLSEERGTAPVSDGDRSALIVG